MNAEARQDHFIVFLRHGESVGNAQDRFQGQADFPLTENGQEQAAALARRWQVEGASFDQAIASPLLRARQTAEIVCSALRVPLEFDPDWMEIDNGLLAGLNGEEAAQRLLRPEFMTPYNHLGQTGESRWELYLRAGRCIQKLLDRPPARYLVVAHGAVLGMAMYAMLSIAPQADTHGPRFVFENTTFATMLYQSSRNSWRLLAFDNRSHWNREN
jgi:2,3-bisphosphoglycerate-dependent phosphoglycerate mutase